MDHAKQDSRCLKGVGCSVTNCRYNDTECKACKAEHISVQNRSALNKGETFCDTFAPKTGV